MSEFIMWFGRMAGAGFGGIFFMMLGEWAHFGCVGTRSEPVAWSTPYTIGVLLFCAAISFLLTFGFARQ